MKITKRLPYSSRGFTLIELLIVIVIIGILAGVLVSVINPAQQQNRAKDANVKSTINKVALSAQAFMSAYGRYPDGLDLFSSLSNATCNSAGCVAATRANNALLSVTGNDLPATCGAGNFTGTGSNQCYYRYETDGSTYFYLYAKSFGLPNTVFRFSTGDSTIKECTNAATPSCP